MHRNNESLYKQINWDFALTWAAPGLRPQTPRSATAIVEAEPCPGLPERG